MHLIFVLFDENENFLTTKISRITVLLYFLLFSTLFSSVSIRDYQTNVDNPMPSMCKEDLSVWVATTAETNIE